VGIPAQRYVGLQSDTSRFARRGEMSRHASAYRMSLMYARLKALRVSGGRSLHEPFAVRSSVLNLFSSASLRSIQLLRSWPGSDVLQFHAQDGTSKGWWNASLPEEPQASPPGRNNNDGTSMLLSRAAQPQRWPINAVPATTMSHRCCCPPPPHSIYGTSLRSAERR
jgi:hypothetical protein